MRSIIKKDNVNITRYFGFILTGITCIFSFAASQNCGNSTNYPNWEDNPGAYENTASLTAVILQDGLQSVDQCDLLAAFDDDGNIRGLATMLFDVPVSGPYQGTNLFEMQMRSNTSGNTFSFRYYDASKDEIYKVVETYDFSINDIQGNVIEPIEYNVGFVNLSFFNATLSSVKIKYESNIDIGGFQFNYSGITLTANTSSDIFSTNFANNILIATSVSGASLSSGVGTLILLVFEELSGENTLIIENIIISDTVGLKLSNSGLNNLEIHAPPELFRYNQSMEQAFYYFAVVMVNDIEVEANDWVGAFNGDVCVGARQWDTSQCGGGICDVPVMGDDNSDGTAGYMEIENIPTFQIYDASENSYYDATPLEDLSWFSNGQNFIDVLIADASISGCMDPDYCNYDPFAIEDDGSCDYVCIGCTDDTEGTNPDVNNQGSYLACNYNPIATIDDGNECYYAEEHKDCGNNCIATIDCAGKCGGTAIIDDCGFCSGGTTDHEANSEKDCAGVCPNEEGFGAYEDNCEECVGGTTTLEACALDCLGEWGGSAITNHCGICTVNNLSEDECPNCGPGLALGCDGNCSATPAENDECGVCEGDSSTCKDCAGVVNGPNIYDHCGLLCIVDPQAQCSEHCDDDLSNDCILDCAAVWGGDAEKDDCDICGGVGPEEYHDCDGKCIAELDCNGTCGGPYVATFHCINDDIVCNPSDCNLGTFSYLVPDKFGINKIFPNPFNPITQIQYEIFRNAIVLVQVYDIQGRVVERLMNEYQGPGQYNIKWDADNHASGMYIVEMVIRSRDDTEIFSDIQKILYIK